MADMSSVFTIMGVDALSGPAGTAEASLEKLGATSSRTSNTLQTALGAAAVAGVVGLGAALASTITTAANFEKQISAISAVAGPVTGGIEALRAKALELGRDTSFSASEAAAGMEELVKAGVSIADVMAGGARAALDLAAAGAVSVTEAATVASSAMNAFGLQGSDLAHIVDLLAGASVASATDVTQLGFAIASVGAVAHGLGLSLDDTTTAVSLLASAGLKGSDAGTSLKTMLLNLSPSTKKATDEMKALGIITAEGSNQFFDAQGNVKSMAEIAGVLQTATAGLTKEQKINALQTIFGTDAIRASTIMAEQGTEGFNKMTAAEKAAGSAQAIATERLNNFRGSMEKLSGSVETGAIIIGSLFLPALKDIADSATDMVNAVLPMLEEIPDAWRTIGQVFENDWSPDETLSPFINAVGMAALEIKGLIDIVVGLPEPVKAAGIAFATVMLAAGPLNTVLGLTIDLFGLLLAPVAAILSPLGLVALAVAGLAAAWTTNLGDIQDKTAEFMAIVVPAFSGLGAIMQTAINGDIAGAFTAFTTLVTDTGLALVPLFAAWGAEFVAWVPGAILALTTTLTAQVALIPWGPIWAAATTAATSLATFLGTLVVDFTTWLTAQVALIKWGEIWATMKTVATTLATYVATLAVDFTTWLSAQVVKIPWATIWANATTVATELATYVSTLTVDFATWLGEQVAAIPWADVWAKITGMAESLTEALKSFTGTLAWGDILTANASMASDMTSAFGTKLTEAIDAVKWAEVGQDIGRGVVDAIGIALGLEQVADAWATGFANAIVKAGPKIYQALVDMLAGVVMGALEEAWNRAIAGWVPGLGTVTAPTPGSGGWQYTPPGGTAAPVLPPTGVPPVAPLFPGPGSTPPGGGPPEGPILGPPIPPEAPAATTPPSAAPPSAVSPPKMPAAYTSEWEQKAYIAAVKANHPDPIQFVEQMRQESGLDPTAYNPGSGATGIAQIVPQYHPGVNANDPQASLDYAANLMTQNIAKYGDPNVALAAYNAGPGRVAQYGGVPPYKETQDYIARINAATDAVKSLTAAEPPSGTGPTPAGMWTPGEAQVGLPDPGSGLSPGETPGALPGSPGNPEDPYWDPNPPGSYVPPSEQPLGPIQGPAVPPPKLNIGAINTSLNQFQASTLTADEALAACGPAAATWFAQAVGRNPTLGEATALAKKFGWTPSQGMPVAGEEPLINSLIAGSGYEAVSSSPTAANVNAGLASGSPVGINALPGPGFAGHYFVATGGTAEGGLDVGATGTALKGGKSTYTLAELQALGGGLANIITLAPVATAALNDTGTATETMGTQAAASTPELAGIGTAIDPLVGMMDAGSLSAAQLGDAIITSSANQGVAVESTNAYAEGLITQQEAMVGVLNGFAETTPAAAALSEQLSTGAITVDDAAIAFAGLATTTATATGEIGTATGELAAKMPLDFETAAAGATLATTTMATDVGTTVGNLVSGVVTLADGMDTGVSGSFDSMDTDATASIVSMATDTGATMVNMVGAAVTLADGMNTGVSGSADTMGTDVASAVGTMATDVGGIFTDMVGSTVQLADDQQVGISGSADEANTNVSGSFDEISTNVGSALDALTEPLANTAEDVSAVGTVAGEAVGPTGDFAGSVDEVGSAADTATQPTEDFGSALSTIEAPDLGGVAGDISSIASAAKGAAKEVGKLGSILDELGSEAGKSLGKKAAGGPVFHDSSYIVGERGPELFVPSQSGWIVPNHRLRGLATGGFVSVGPTSVSGGGSPISVQIGTALDDLLRQIGKATSPELSALTTKFVTSVQALLQTTEPNGEMSSLVTQFSDIIQAAISGAQPLEVTEKLLQTSLASLTKAVTAAVAAVTPPTAVTPPGHGQTVVPGTRAGFAEEPPAYVPPPQPKSAPFVIPGSPSMGKPGGPSLAPPPGQKPTGPLPPGWEWVEVSPGLWSASPTGPAMHAAITLPPPKPPTYVPAPLPGGGVPIDISDPYQTPTPRPPVAEPKIPKEKPRLGEPPMLLNPVIPPGPPPSISGGGNPLLGSAPGPVLTGGGNPVHPGATGDIVRMAASAIGSATTMSTKVGAATTVMQATASTQARNMADHVTTSSDLMQRDTTSDVTTMSRSSLDAIRELSDTAIVTASEMQGGVISAAGLMHDGVLDAAATMNEDVAGDAGPVSDMKKRAIDFVDSMRSDSIVLVGGPQSNSMRAGVKAGADALNNELNTAPNGAIADTKKRAIDHLDDMRNTGIDLLGGSRSDSLRVGIKTNMDVLNEGVSGPQGAIPNMVSRSTGALDTLRDKGISLAARMANGDDDKSGIVGSFGEVEGAAADAAGPDGIGAVQPELVTLGAYKPNFDKIINELKAIKKAADDAATAIKNIPSSAGSGGGGSKASAESFGAQSSAVDEANLARLIGLEIENRLNVSHPVNLALTVEPRTAEYEIVEALARSAT